MVLIAPAIPMYMYPNLPCTRHEYETIHRVDRINAWIEKYQSDTYLEIYNSRSNDSMDFAIELYPNDYNSPVSPQPANEDMQTISELLCLNAQATLSMSIGVSHHAYMSFTMFQSSVSTEVLLAQFETNSSWIFDEVLVPRWVTMEEFQDETYLLELPCAQVYGLLTQAMQLPINAGRRGLVEEIEEYLDTLQKEHPNDEFVHYPHPPVIIPQYTVPTIPWRPRVLPPSWKAEAQASTSIAIVHSAPPTLVANCPQSLLPSYRAPVTHGMTTHSYGELYKLCLCNHSIGRMKYSSLP